MSHHVKEFLQTDFRAYFAEDFSGDFSLEKGRRWETDFYTPPVLGGAALFDNSAPAMYKTSVP